MIERACKEFAEKVRGCFDNLTEFEIAQLLEIIRLELNKRFYHISPATYIVRYKETKDRISPRLRKEFEE